jgi:uncharacterized protein YbjT (DUF2867 family)
VVGAQQSARRREDVATMNEPERPTAPVVFVSGAPGNVGSELVRLLAARGAAVRALVHSAEHGEALREAPVEVVTGDLTDPATYADALAGVGAVFVNSSTLAVRLQTDLVRAAAEAGVGRLVKLSWMGVSGATQHGIGGPHAAVEQAMRDSGVPAVVLRANAFMQNYLPQITAPGPSSLFVTSDRARASIVDARDVAAVAAELLLNERGLDHVYDVTGPHALSNDEIATTIAAATGRPVAVARLSADQLADAFHRSGQPEWLAGELAWTEALRESGALEPVSAAVEALLGRPPETFERFVQRECEALRRPH